MVESVLVMLSPAFCDFGWCVAGAKQRNLSYSMDHIQSGGVAMCAVGIHAIWLSASRAAQYDEEW